MGTHISIPRFALHDFLRNTLTEHSSLNPYICQTRLSKVPAKNLQVINCCVEWAQSDDYIVESFWIQPNELFCFVIERLIQRDHCSSLALLYWSGFAPQKKCYHSVKVVCWCWNYPRYPTVVISSVLFPTAWLKPVHAGMVGTPEASIRLITHARSIILHSNARVGGQAKLFIVTVAANFRGTCWAGASTTAGWCNFVGTC